MTITLVIQEPFYRVIKYLFSANLYCISCQTLYEASFQIVIQHDFAILRNWIEIIYCGNPFRLILPDIYCIRGLP